MYTLAFLLLGIITWTFLEYVIHRFLGHKRKGNGLIRTEHQRHHREVNYFSPIFKKLILALVVLSCSTIITGLLFNFKNGFMFSLGLASMYFIYEVAHRLYHIKAPFIRFGLRMRKHHFYHHFVNPKYNHGVTTAFWDRVFRTFKPVTTVKVSKRMPLIWLTQSENKIKFSNHFITSE